MDRTHWCFTCEKICSIEELEEICSKNHYNDIDFEDQFTPSASELKITESKPQRKGRDSKTLVLEFAKQNIKYPVVSGTDSSMVYGLVEINSHLESILLGAESSKEWLKFAYYQKEEEFFGSEIYDNVISLMCSIARHNPKIKPTSINKRVASDNDSIYVDLGSSDWNLVKITADELKIVNHGENTPIFARNKRQSQIPEPCFNYHGNPLNELSKLLRMEKEPLFIIHIIADYLSHIPTPGKFITGGEDTAKSTTSAMIKKVIDPSGESLEDQLTQFGRNADDLNIQFANNYYIAFDNVSYISSEQSDNFCRAITGATYSKRMNYADSDEIVLRYLRKISINGIGLTPEHSDLARRMIHYKTNPIKEKITLAKILTKLKNILPDLYGQIFVTLQKAIQLYPEVSEEITEIVGMADFCIWGECISRALGNKPFKFIEDYKAKINQNSELLKESNCIVQFLEKEFEAEKVEKIVRSVGNTYQRLKEYATDENLDQKSRYFPKASNKLRNCVERSQPLLEKFGIEIIFENNTGQHDGITPNATVMIATKKIVKQENLNEFHL